MLSLSALVVSSMLLATPDVTPPPAPAENPVAAWRPAFVVAGVAVGVVGGGYVGYLIGDAQDCSGCIVDLAPASGAVIGGVLGGLAGGVLTGVVTGLIFHSSESTSAVILVPTMGGRETAGLHLQLKF
jgi:hypothetical protein